MAFVVTNRMGEMFDSPDGRFIDDALAELDGPVDDEHPDVSLTHESGWSLGAFPSGGLAWEHLDENEPRHMQAVSRSEVRRLWLALVSGDLRTVDAEDRKPGYW